jgi:hypothetical protein
MPRLLLVICVLASLAGAARAGGPELRVVFTDDFSKGTEHWQPTDPAAWKADTKDKFAVFHQFKNSNYKPPHRSPLNIALVKDKLVQDFVFEAKALSTGKDGPHRDMCLFFGYQDPAHFYYVHIAKKADDHANQIFIVNGADRVKISTKSTDGTPWDDKWHNIKIIRTIADGKIEIYFDDMRTPIMTATDKTFIWGQVGIGSFDDSGYWRDVTLRGNQIAKKGQ